MSLENDLSSPFSRGIRVKMVRKALRLSRKSLGLKYDIPSGTIQNWEDGRFGGLTEKGAKKILQAFQTEGIQCSLEWLMYGSGISPLDGKFIETRQLLLLKNNYEKQISNEAASRTVSSPETEEQRVADELECFYRHHRNAVDMIVADESMQPYFLIGDHLAGQRYFGSDIKQLIGHDCIVQTQAGQIVVRQLQAGYEPESYQLICRNPRFTQSEYTSQNVKLFSAAPVLWIRRKNPVEHNP